MNPLPPSPPAPFPIARPMAVLAGGVLALALVATGVCLALGYPGQIKLNLLAAAVCGGAGLIGLLPVWLMSRHSAYGAAMGFMAGVMFRMFVAGGIVLYTQWGLHWESASAFTFWIAGWYLAVLALEVKLVSSHVLTTLPQPAPGPLAGPAPTEMP